MKNVMRLTKNLVLDARTLLFLNNFALVVIGMLLLKMQRTWIQIIFRLGCTLLTEFLFLYFYKRRRKFEIQQFLSSIVTGIGLILVINAVVWWAYGALSVIAIASKHLLRKNERDHIFNPANFAIIFFIALSPDNLLRIYSDQFAMSKYILYHLGRPCCGDQRALEIKRSLLRTFHCALHGDGAGITLPGFRTRSRTYFFPRTFGSVSCQRHFAGTIATRRRVAIQRRRANSFTFGYQELKKMKYPPALNRTTVTAG